MYHSYVPLKERHSICKEDIQCATLIDGAVVVEINVKREMKYAHFAPNESLPVFINLLITWGEAGVVKTRTKTTTKLADRGMQFMM